MRFVDDFVILDIDQGKLCSLVPKINTFLNINLELKLHPKKIHLQSIDKGVDFLGYYIKPTHTLVRQNVVRRFKDKLYKNRDDEGFFGVADISMIKSYLGHFSHADSFRLRQKLTR